MNNVVNSVISCPQCGQLTLELITRADNTKLLRCTSGGETYQVDRFGLPLIEHQQKDFTPRVKA